MVETSYRILVIDGSVTILDCYDAIYGSHLSQFYCTCIWSLLVPEIEVMVIRSQYQHICPLDDTLVNDFEISQLHMTQNTFSSGGE
jgi:hypothetical protein